MNLKYKPSTPRDKAYAVIKLNDLLTGLERVEFVLKNFYEAQRKQSGGSRLHYTAEINLFLRRRENFQLKINQHRQRHWLW